MLQPIVAVGYKNVTRIQTTWATSGTVLDRVLFVILHMADL